jgi:hypothetical protein
MYLIVNGIYRGHGEAYALLGFLPQTFVIGHSSEEKKETDRLKNHDV